MVNNRSPNDMLTVNKPWIQNSSPIWLASSISLQRNIDKFKFPNKLDVERKKQIVNLVGKEFLESKQFVNPKLFKGEELSFFDKEYLLEHFFTISDFHSASTGEAFLIDESGEWAIIFNLINHISYYKLDTKGDLEGMWAQIVQMENSIGKNLTYAYSQKFGFLTANFDQCGTALEVTTYLHLPALLHTRKIEEILEREADENYLVMGIQGSPSEIIGDLFVIQNNYTLGQTEENSISLIRSFTSKLITEEKQAREALRQARSPEILDLVSRAYAILLYSYQIEAIEALNAISLCKLGVTMGWLSGVTEDELNQLFFNCRRAHLLCQYPDKGNITQEEIPHKRAEFIHRGLKNLKLLI